MAITLVVPGLHEIRLGFVNAFLLETDEGLALVDTGVPGCDEAILDAIRTIGRQPSDLRDIVVTHCHSDHSGSLAALKRLTGATAWMHSEDAAMVRAGNAIRPMSAAPGPRNAQLFEMATRAAPTRIEPAEVEHEVGDGDDLPVAGGLRAFHVPGHCAGQLALLWPRHGGVLFAADAAVNVSGLALSPGYEDLAEGERSLAKLSALEFEVACFGHGRPIEREASRPFRQNWRPPGRGDQTAA
jgi:glyoxylase-like metal-dependent hydrolase (beta-lactamase superfamily II)